MKRFLIVSLHSRKPIGYVQVVRAKTKLGAIASWNQFNWFCKDLIAVEIK